MTQQQSDNKVLTRTVVKVVPAFGKTYWYGTVVTNAFSSQKYRRISCDHHHRSPEAAQKCADRL